VFIQFVGTGELTMLRSVLSAIALAAILATAHPVSADPLAAMASDHTQAATEQAAALAPASPLSSDAIAPANAGPGKDVATVGFG
jgi:hypothetical protein